MSEEESVCLEEGDVWFVKFPGALTLDVKEIVDKYEKVVGLQDNVDITTYSPRYYKISDIEWVEKTDGQD